MSEFESVMHFIDAETEELSLPQYAEFLEELLSEVQSRLDAAQADLAGRNE